MFSNPSLLFDIEEHVTKIAMEQNTQSKMAERCKVRSKSKPCSADKPGVVESY